MPDKPVRRELVQLAHDYDPQKHDVVGWYASEKEDGTRAFWDGGISRGMETHHVPFAGVFDPKTGNFKKKIKPIATGLWSRNGNPIMAPDWFLDQLPNTILDGELSAGRGNFQLCRTIVAGDTPDDRFDQIKFKVFSTPSVDSFCTQGVINSKDMSRVIGGDTRYFFDNEGKHCLNFAGGTFTDEIEFMNNHITQNEYLEVIEQHKIDNLDDLDDYFQKIINLKGEGLILRHPDSVWTPKRTRNVLKHKPFIIGSGVVRGFMVGSVGKKGLRLGKIGSIVCDTVIDGNQVTFEIGTGLNALEAEFQSSFGRDWAVENPRQFTDRHDGEIIKLGSSIEFLYRELTDSGVPKEARYRRP